MQSSINTAELRARPGAADARAGEVSEVDLYSELMAFTELSDEQRSRELEKPAPAGSPDAIALQEEPDTRFDLAPAPVVPASIEVIAHKTEPETQGDGDKSKQIAQQSVRDMEPFRASGPLSLPHLRGLPLASYTAATACPECESESVIGDMFCVACGSLLEAAS